MFYDHYRNRLVMLLICVLLLATMGCSRMHGLVEVGFVKTPKLSTIVTFQRDCLSKPNRSMTLETYYKDPLREQASSYEATCYEGHSIELLEDY